MKIDESAIDKVHKPKITSHDMLACLVLTGSGRLVTRMIKVRGKHLSLCQLKDEKLKQKLKVDLSTVEASFEPQVLTELTGKAANSTKDNFLVHPIRFKLPKKQKLTLFFTKKAGSKACMD